MSEEELRNMSEEEQIKWLEKQTKRIEDYIDSLTPEEKQDLWDRMETMFVQYEQVKLDLKDTQIALTDKGAKATSTYLAHYRTTAGKTRTAAGDLAFQLSKSTGYWKITRIDSQ